MSCWEEASGQTHDYIASLHWLGNTSASGEREAWGLCSPDLAPDKRQKMYGWR